MLVLSLSVGRSVIQKSSFIGGVNQIVADFNYTKQLASRENRYVAVIFNTNGRSYTIHTQDTVGDLSNWTVVKTVEPLDGKEFFIGSSIQNFAVNSVGTVFHYPIINTIPSAVTLNFFIKYDPRGVIDYQKIVNIYPYGGIKVE